MSLVSPPCQAASQAPKWNPEKNPSRVSLEKEFQFCRQVRDGKSQELFDRIHLVEDITTLRASSPLKNSLEPKSLKKIWCKQNKQISPMASTSVSSWITQASYTLHWASHILSGATYTLPLEALILLSSSASTILSMATYILSWVTFTLSGASYTLHGASHILSSRASTILSSATNILSSSASTILSWATYTTTFTFIVILTTLCFITSNPRLSIPLTFIILFIFCLKLECGRGNKRRRLL